MSPLRFRHYRLSWLGRGAILPKFERVCRGFWFANLLGFSLWIDTTPPLTVGERGAW